MARKKRGFIKTLIGLIIIAVVMVAVLWGIGYLDLRFIGLGSATEVFSQQEPLEEEFTQYHVTIEVQGNDILLNDEVVVLENLSGSLGDITNQTVMLIDKEAKHATWSEVKSILEGKNCIIHESVQ